MTINNSCRVYGFNLFFVLFFLKLDTIKLYTLLYRLFPQCYEYDKLSHTITLKMSMCNADIESKVVENDGGQN